MAVKTRIQCEIMLLVLGSLSFVSFLVYQSGNSKMFWSLYIIPIIITALSFDLICGALVGVLSVLSMFCWSFFFGVCVPQYSDKLWIIGLGMLIFLVTGFLLGQSYRTVMNLEGANRDKLTGLYNYKYFMDSLESERKRAMRYENSISVIKLEVDNLDNIHDLFGQEKYDDVLKRIANILHGKIRDVDFATRRKRGEFVIALPNTDNKGAFIVAERLRNLMSAEKFEGDNEEPQFKVTVSEGIATYPAQAEGVNKLMHEADHSLSVARDSGGNQIYSRTK